MNNILKSTVTLPFKFIKGIFELMKAILNTILKMFGHPGLPSGGAHSAENMAPEEELSKDETKSENDLSKRLSLDQANKVVNDNSLNTIKAYVSSKDRKQEDIATLSKTMRLYMSGLSPAKLQAMSKLNDQDLRMAVCADLMKLKDRQTQVLKNNDMQVVNEKENEIEPDDKKAKRLAIKKRMQQKMNANKSTSMSFAM